ncbi:MAG: TVP38/TMEM64 family protein [Rhodothalassiaceae bacterium]
MSTTTVAQSPAKKSTPLWRRLLPLFILVALIGAAFATGVHEYFTLQALKENRELLRDFVESNVFVAGLVFVLVYTVAVALSLPGALFLTLAGGFMFGTVLGGLLVVTGATVGATIIFLIAKTSLGELFREKAGKYTQKLEAGFKEGALSYMFVLRLVPLFPFFVVNLVPAFLGVSTGTYVIATFFGIMPGTFVYASVGNGIGQVFDEGGQLDLGIIFDPAVLGPLLGLAALSLIPVLYKKLAKKKTVPAT